MFIHLSLCFFYNCSNFYEGGQQNKMHSLHCCRFPAIVDSASSHRLSLSLGPHPGSRIRPTRAKPDDKRFKAFFHVSGCPPGHRRQPGPADTRNAWRGRRSGFILKTCPSQRRRDRLITSRSTRLSTPRTRCLTSALLMRCCHHTRASLRKHRCSNTSKRRRSSARVVQLSHP